MYSRDYKAVLCDGLNWAYAPPTLDGDAKGSVHHIGRLLIYLGGMNRVIKFRAWDLEEGKMVSLESIVFDFGGNVGEISFTAPEGGPVSSRADGDDTVLMQFTGLLDKNGMEIWEGDVIEHERYDRPYSKKKKTWKVRGAVTWYAGFNHSEKTVKDNPILKENPSMFNQNPMFRVKIGNDQKSGGYDWSEFHNCEVIGNIYENPELLNV